MLNNSEIRVREMESSDIENIGNYWMSASPDFLLSLGAEKKRMPSLNEWREMLQKQLNSDYKTKKSFAVIAMNEGQTIGHCNVNEIEFGKQAKMHLHIWEERNRRKGLGSAMIQKAIPFFFKYLDLEELFCEPYAKNEAPNKTLDNLGFSFIKKYRTIPGSLSFEQEVNQWKIDKNHPLNNQ